MSPPQGEQGSSPCCRYCWGELGPQAQMQGVDIVTSQVLNLFAISKEHN